MKSGNSQVILTGGAWSPTRPGCFNPAVFVLIMC